ncbi:MAG: adenylate/guanylate cyclase domain-containing protein [Hyphomicrobiales bacterium]|nr:adenylate/guanylate cyclase domain-containing protein [Hyphomicrobiales bacterium]MCP4997762.1 adenylate/guanylate cyclase domain-containing protein [Hyphomicrobiales bacterium]
MNNTTKRKLFTVIIGTLSFVLVGVVAGIAIGVPISNAVILATWIGLGVSLFEVLYIQAPLGIGFRKLSPLKHSLLYACLILLLYITGVAFLVLYFAPPSMAEAIIARIPITLPVVFLISVTIMLILRVVSFIGGKNLLHLLTGRYQRPMQENRAFLFIDLKDSTNITESLGVVRAREFISEFIFDVSKSITDNRGDIYKFMGDGIVAVWQHDDSSSISDAVSAVLDARKALASRSKHYRDTYGYEAEFRAGLHAGVVIASEQGDLRRSIEFNGDHINIAARLEQKAKDHNLLLVFSDVVAEELSGTRFEPVSFEEESVKGYSKPIRLFKLKQVQI